jgi:hypothetical protein
MQGTLTAPHDNKINPSGEYLATFNGVSLPNSALAMEIMLSQNALETILVGETKNSLKLHQIM